MEAQPIPASVVVAGHICLDIIPSLSDANLPGPGQLSRIGPAAISTGGAVANTGLALHRLGVPVRLMGKVGDDAFGRVILGILQSYASSLASEMIVAPNSPTSYSIVINPPGVDRSFMHCPGANDTFSADDVRIERLAGARLFHFGYPPLMRQMYSNGGSQLQLLLERVRSRGLATSLDMAHPGTSSQAGVNWPELLHKVLPFVDLFLPSAEEILSMLDFQTLVIDAPLLRRLAEKLLNMGAAVVAIKLGDQGIYLRTSANSHRIADFCRRMNLNPSAWQDKEIYSPAFRAREIVGTTGAGDCAIAGFLTSLLHGQTPSEAATAANAVGACSVEAADATGGVPPWHEVQTRLRAGWERLPATTIQFQQGEKI